MKWSIIILAFILISCGGRKAQVEVTKIDTKTDLNIAKTNDITTAKDVIRNNYIVQNTQDFEIEPIDNTKPIKINGIEYQNVRLKSKSTKTVDTSKILQKEITKDKSKTIVNRKATKSKFTKEKKITRFSMWGILIIIGVAISLYILKN